jgi:hypothetical protein
MYLIRHKRTGICFTRSQFFQPYFSTDTSPLVFADKSEAQDCLNELHFARDRGNYEIVSEWEKYGDDM